jgi:diguanylate cyclase (GGDEF)-like protein
VPNKGIAEDPARQGNGEEKGADLTRLAQVVADQQSVAPDESAGDADQTGSDADRTVSDMERALADGGQIATDRDQVASDWDQAERAIGTWEREESGESRAVAAEARARLAEQRDQRALDRDHTAEARDDAAARRDQDSSKIERKMASRGTSLRTALTHASEVRILAANDRARAAEDRAQAAADRERAAEEREAAIVEIRQAHRDELTGAYRRGSGEEALQSEIDRARRADEPLVVAFIDVDGLREVNNREGHAVGDALLREVVSAVRSRIRSYEPIVRFGGDEFVCAVGGLDLAEGEDRFAEIQGALAESRASAALSFGLAELREDDTLADLIERADVAMLEARRGR